MKFTITWGALIKTALLTGIFTVSSNADVNRFQANTETRIAEQYSGNPMVGGAPILEPGEFYGPVEVERMEPRYTEPMDDIVIIYPMH